MASVEARISVKGKHFEILVDLEEALKVKTGKGNVQSALQSNAIFHNIKKGDLVSKDELENAFGTADIFEVAKHIMTKGEVQKNQEFRDAEKEKRMNQIFALLLRNCSDQFGKPYTEDRLRRATTEAHYNFDNRPAEQQMISLLEKLKTIIPIKLEIKKFKLTVPAQYTAQVYGILSDYKQSEDWLSNGSLSVIVSIPAGLTIDFFDKINGKTHGAIISEEFYDKI
jgi:ribosome maturation protein SDO1